MASERNPSIELYRVLMMFGIVLLHTIVHGGYLRSRGLDNVALSCVDAFVFISGYFGIRFRLSKVVSLLLSSAWCLMVVVGMRCFFCGTGWSGDVFCGCDWFLWAYVLLMCFAPIFESVFSNQEKVVALIFPILFVVFVWSYMSMWPMLKGRIPAPVGFSPRSFLTLIGIYLVARMVKIYNVDSRLPVWSIMVIGGVSVGGAWIGFGHYNSAFALGIALSGFALFSRLRIPSSRARIVIWCVPSLFPIYLLHANSFGFPLLVKVNEWYIDGCHIPLYIGHFLTSLTVFCVCLIVDQIRRGAVYGVKKAGVTLQCIDVFYDRFVAILQHKVESRP